MSDSVLISWGPRPEPPEAIHRRWSQWLDVLGRASPQAIERLIYFTPTGRRIDSRDVGVVIKRSDFVPPPELGIVHFGVRITCANRYVSLYAVVGADDGNQVSLTSQPEGPRLIDLFGDGPLRRLLCESFVAWEADSADYFAESGEDSQSTAALGPLYRIMVEPKPSEAANAPIGYIAQRVPELQDGVLLVKL